MPMNRFRALLGEKLFKISNYGIMLLFAFVCVYPFYYVFIFSISDARRTAAENIYFLPAGFSLASFEGIFRLSNIFNAFLVSLARTVLGTIITVICSAFFAFLVTKKEMYFRKFVYRMLIVTMYLNAGVIPYYLVMKAYGFRNSFLLYIIPSAVGAFYVVLVKTYIESLPTSIEESALIDGAGYLTLFWRIMMPLIKPILATIAVYSSVGQWNSYFDNFLFISDSRLNTLQLVLYNYLNSSQQLTNMTTQELGASNIENIITPASIRMCITITVTLPIIFAYPLMQRYFVKGIMMGAVKG